MANQVQFVITTAEKYKGIESKDQSTLYYLSDTKKVMRGDTDYTDAVRIVASRPATPAAGVLYLTNGVLETYDGTNWVSLSKAYVLYDETNKAILASTDTNDTVPTSKLVYESIKTAVENATGSGEVVNDITSTKAGIITVSKGGVNTDVKIKGAVVNPAYDSATRTITLPYADGTESLVIALGKDMVVKSGTYDKTSKKIILTLTDDSTVEIPAADLVDIYTGGTTSSAAVAVSAGNEITATVKVSTEANNIVTVKDDGLYAADNTATLKAYADTKASTAESNAKTYADGLATNYDAAGSAAAAETNAKTYADNAVASAMTWVTIE